MSTRKPCSCCAAASEAKRRLCSRSLGWTASWQLYVRIHWPFGLLTRPGSLPSFLRIGLRVGLRWPRFVAVRGVIQAAGLCVLPTWC